MTFTLDPRATPNPYLVNNLLRSFLLHQVLSGTFIPRYLGRIPAFSGLLTNCLRAADDADIVFKLIDVLSMGANALLRGLSFVQ